MRAAQPGRRRWSAALAALAVFLVALWLAWWRAPLAEPASTPALTNKRASPEEAAVSDDLVIAEPLQEPRAARPPPVHARDAGVAYALEDNIPWFGFCGANQSPAALGFRMSKRFSRSRSERALLSSQSIDELTIARAAHPDDPLLALRLGTLLTTTVRLADAEQALTAYLKKVPYDGPTAQLLARLGTQREIQDHYARVDHAGVTVSYPPEVLSAGAAYRVAQDVRRALDDAARLTRLRARDTLTVVVYPSRSELLAVSCAPVWANGLFDGTLRLVAKGTTVGSEDLRHESLHAQVSPQVDNLPRWFSEGLAEYFANRNRVRGAGNLRVFARERTWIPFSSMVASFSGLDADDSQLFYVQSNAMVRWLIVTRGEGVIADAIAWLNRGEEPEGLFAALAPDGTLSEAAFGEWMRSQKW